MKVIDLLNPFQKVKSSYNTNTVLKESPVAHQQKGAGETCLKFRYIVALLGFAVFCLLNIHRMNMNISIVAMVNHTALHVYHKNETTVTCPTSNETTLLGPDIEVTNIMEGEFDWSPETQGYILGSGFMGYFLTQFIAGKLSEYFGGKWVLFWGTLLASLSTVFTPYASWCNVYILIAVQTIRGMSQGVFAPAVSVLISNWFPRIERGCIFTFIFSGTCVGAMVGGLLTGYMCQSSFLGGWPVIFYTFGVVGILLSAAIAIFLYENPSVHPAISESELKFILNHQDSKLSQRRPRAPWRRIFSETPIYALSFAFFGQFWAAAHCLTEQATFLGTILHFPIDQNGFFSSVPFLLQTVFTLVSSWISDFLNRREYVSVDKVRKFWNFMSCLGYSLCLIGMYLAKCNRTWSVAFSILSIGFVGFGFSGCIIVPADMSPTFSGSVMGLACTIGTSASFILPFIVGILTNDLQTFDPWNKIFFISIGVVMTSGIAFAIFGSAEVQSWNYVEEKNNSIGIDEEENRKESVLDCKR